jgi:TP901 family phage tail tape measure protein
LTRILGITIAGDDAASPAIKEAVGSLETFDAATQKAAKSVERLAAQRANLKLLATAYQEVADSSVKGSDQQQIALAKVADAQKRLTAQVSASAAKTKEASLALGSLGSSAGKAESLVSKLSGSMALWLGAPALGAGLASAIHGTQQYAAAMEQLHTQAGASQAEVTRMSAALLNLGPQVGTSADVLATGLYHLESQGLRGAKALSTLRIAAEGARIGNANLEDVTNALGAAIYAGIKGTENYAHTMGVLNATVGAGDMHMQDLADAMGTGLPAAAATYGVSIRDVGAALAVFGDNNIRGAEAGTRLASALRLMAAPSKVAAKELAGLGLSSTQLADDIRNQGLTYAIGDLKQHMDAMGLTASQQGVVLTRAFGGKQAQGILLLIDEFDRLKQKEEAVGAGGQKFGRDWQAYTQQSQFATQKFQAALETLRIEVGNAILPEFTKATNSLAAWIDKENKSGQIAKDVKVALGDLVTVLRTAKTIIDDVDSATGGLTHTLELLAGIKLASAIAGWSTAIAGIGAASVTAEAEVTGLRGALLGLGAPEVLAALAAAYGAAKLIENMLHKDTKAPASYGPGLKAGESIAKVQSDLGFYTASGQTSAQGYFALNELQKLMLKAGSVVATSAEVAQAAKLAVKDLAAIPSTLASDAAAARANVGKSGGAVSTSFIAQEAAKYGLDPKAVLGVASNEGLSGGIGDGGHAFGPFQLNNAGGVITGMFPGQSTDQIQAWAWSPAGIDWALQHMASSGAAGLTGAAAVDAIVSNFERPKNPAGDLAAGYRAVGASTPPSTAAPSAATLAGLGLGPAGAKAKRPAIASGASEIPASVAASIEKAKTEIKNTQGTVALDWVDKERSAIEKAQKDLRDLASKQTGKQAAATEREIASLGKQLDSLAVIRGSQLLPQKLQDAITGFKNDAKDATGAEAEKYLKDERVELTKALGILKRESVGKTGAQLAAIKKEADGIDSQVATVNKEIAANLKAQAQAIKTNARTSISSAKSSIGQAFSQIVSDARSAFEQNVSDYINGPLAAQYYQGSQTPLEAQLAGMQAADTAKSLQDALTQAQASGDQAAIAQAQRAIDENNLSIQATAQRAQADKDYANAAKQYQDAQKLQEDRMTTALKNLATGVENGTQTINGPGGLSDVLAQFGVSASSIATDDMSALSTATQSLAKVMAAEAVALAKVGDSKDAKAAAATASALLSNLNASSSTGTHLPPAFGHVPMLASGGDITREGIAYLHRGERVQPASVVSSPAGAAGASLTIQVIAPNYVGDKRDLADAIKSPQVQEAVATAVILASRGGHIRQGDIRP